MESRYGAEELVPALEKKGTEYTKGVQFSYKSFKWLNMQGICERAVVCVTGFNCTYAVLLCFTGER